MIDSSLHRADISSVTELTDDAERTVVFTTAKGSSSSYALFIHGAAKGTR